MQYYHIYDNMYAENIRIYVLPPKKAKKLLHKEYKIPYKEMERFKYRHGTTFELVEGNFVIWMRAFDKDNPIHFSKMMHELLHVSLYLLDKKGVKHSADNSEALTYHFEFLVREFLKQQ